MSQLSEDIFRILDTPKSKELEKVSRAAADDPDILAVVLEGLTSTEAEYRENCYNAIYPISEACPELLYPYWDQFEDMLSSKNAFHQMIGVRLLANLTAIDTGGKFQALFDEFFDLMDTAGLIVARFVAQSGGKIARHQPALREDITQRLLEVENSQQKQKELLKTDVINSFAEYYSQSEDKAAILAFVAAQTDSGSPKTKEAAAAFLAQFGS